MIRITKKNNGSIKKLHFLRKRPYKNRLTRHRLGTRKKITKNSLIFHDMGYDYSNNFQKIKIFKILKNPNNNNNIKKKILEKNVIICTKEKKQYQINIITKTHQILLKPI